MGLEPAAADRDERLGRSSPTWLSTQARNWKSFSRRRLPLIGGMLPRFVTDTGPGVLGCRATSIRRPTKVSTVLVRVPLQESAKVAASWVVLDITQVLARLRSQGVASTVLASPVSSLSTGDDGVLTDCRHAAKRSYGWDGPRAWRGRPSRHAYGRLA